MTETEPNDDQDDVSNDDDDYGEMNDINWYDQLIE